MRHTILLTIAITFLSALSAFSQDKVQLFDAFKNADANAISTYFNDNIEMTLPNAQNFFTKSQARGILADFFKKNPVSDFTVLHTGNKENSAFTIGNLKTANGIYRVSFFARKVPNATKKQIYLLRIEKSLESEK
jgi:hypothetical protein